MIGGTGVYDLPGVEMSGNRAVDTRYGAVQLAEGLYRSAYTTWRLLFLPRHGTAHSIPPHRINYRANVQALQQVGATYILATNAVGSLRQSILPGELVLLDQFIDFTRGRAHTFFDGSDGEVRHTDMTAPYDEVLRMALQEAAHRAGLSLRSRGTYVCTEGPRFETAAEVAMFAQLGGDVVGMTGVPEVVLARELGLPYAAVALVTNLGAGISTTPLTHEEVVAAMDHNGHQLLRLVQSLLERPFAEGMSATDG